MAKSELGITWTKTEFDAAIEETGVTLDQSSLELVVDNTATLTATVAPNNATDKTVTWTSSDANVATVENGVVTGVAAGTATITVTTSNGKTADCTVTVKSEYDAMVAAYEKAAILKYTTCFDNCEDDTEVHDDKNIPNGEFYYLAKDSAYDGSVKYDFDGVNGYILMKEAYGQRIDVKPTEADAKYVIVESKIRYNTSGIKLEFGLRGVKSNGNASVATLGTIEKGTFTTNTGGYSKTITSGEQICGFVLCSSLRKMLIMKATRHWRGLNSSSILEPIVRLYNLTKKQRYLDFASYIVECGGTDVVNVFELAYEDKLYPYQYPVTKAYEMTSCFEGLLEYYYVTGEEKYKTCIINYANKILESDFTIIGCCGCTHELFLLTGDSKYVDAFETSFYNAYLGSINTEKVIEPSLLEEHPDWSIEPLPFDSYSPLTAGTGGNGIGGLKLMSDNHYYGCCACIGSAGLGLFPQMALVKQHKELYLNLYMDGNMETTTPSGNKLVIKMVANKGYVCLDKVWISGETIELDLDMRTECIKPIPYGHQVLMNHVIWGTNYIIPTYDEEDPAAKKHRAFRRGPLVLAQENRLGYSVDEHVGILIDEDGYVKVAFPEIKVAPYANLLEVEMPLMDGTKMHVTDYASAGKLWTTESKMAAWMLIK